MVLDQCEDVTRFLNSGPDRLDIRHGPLVAASVLEAQDRQLTIALTAHHLVVDLVSWRILLDEFETMLKGEPLGDDSILSFQTWCVLQQEHVNNNLSPETSLPFHVPAAPYAYWGMANQPNEYSDVLTEEFILEESTVVNLLGPSNSTLRSEPIEILLAVLHYSFNYIFSDRGPPQVFNEGHGRQCWDETLDLSRTVGWFTILSPVCIDLPYPSTKLEYLAEVMRVRRSTPANGRDYFATRYLHRDAAKHPAYRGHLPMEILFNFMGTFQQLDRSDALFHVAAPEMTEPFTEIQTGRRDNLSETAIMVNGGRAMCRLEYNRRMLHQDRIKSWWRCFNTTLVDFTAELCSTAPIHTACEYPLLALQPRQFHSLENAIAEITGDPNLDGIEDVYPCTPMQVGILLSQMQDRQLYAVHTTWELTLPSASPVPELMVSAWKRVVQYQPVLRTVFVENGALENPFYQVVYKSVQPETMILHVDHASQAPETVLQSLSAPGYKQGRPCHRLTLAACSCGQVYCRLDLSHTIVDGYSMDILIRDLKTAYMQPLDSTNPPRFSDFVGHLLEQHSVSDLAYWKNHLNSLEPCLMSSFLEAQGGQAIETKPERHSVALDMASSDIAAFCREQKVTTFNVIQAAWALVLKVHTMSDEVCFGYLVFNRDLPIEGLGDVVGPFISMLVQRVTVSGSSTLLESIKSIQRDVLTSLKHRHASLVDIHHALNQKPRSLFNTILSFQRQVVHSDASSDPMSLAFREVERVDPAEYDLSVGLKETSSRLDILISYWSTYMDGTQADSIIHTFHQAINLIVAQPEEQIGQTALVSAHDLERLEYWNRNEQPSVDVCVHDMVSIQAKQTPHATAIEASDEKFTYAEMDGLSNRLAGYLCDADVRQGDCVGLCFSKSAWATVASLAVLKAGGVCVQLDPEWPPDRKQNILNRIEARTILVSLENHSHFKEARAQTLVIDRATSISWPDQDSNIGTATTPDEAAFVLFTSGSTGEPKGAVIPHSAMTSSSLAHGKVQGVRSESRVYQFAAYTFDVAVADTFTTLIHGGCICVPSEFDRLNDLTGSIKRLKANWIHLTPTVSRLLQPDDLPELRTMVVGGEALSADVVDRWAHKCNLINTYGPAECSVTSACHTSIQPRSSTSSIGTPVGTRIWIVDPTNHNILLPVGAVGEILVEGPTLAHGYLGDEGMTNSAFTQNVAWAKPSSRRFYKTDDLGCWTSQGSLAFSRRKDSTVKLRGVKVNLGDIECAIKGLLPSACIVAAELTKVSQAGLENELMAFVGASNSSALDMVELRAQVSRILPSHMVPKVIVPLGQMPLTASGKIDRKILRRMSSEITESQLARYTRQGERKNHRPLTEPESKMARLWERILNLPSDSITCNDSFLEVGGDSLSAMKLVALARGAGINLTVASIFRQPRLSVLCSTIVATVEPAPAVQTKTLEPFALIDGSFGEKVALRAEIAAALGFSADDIEDAYPVTPLQESVMASSVNQPGAFTLQETIKIPEGIDLARFRAAWTQVVDHVSILRTRIVTTAARGMIQALVKDATRWLQLDSTLDAYLSADMENAMGPGTALSRVAVVRDDAVEKTYFVWTMSLALYDGPSRPVMWEAVERAYRGETLRSFPSFVNYVAYLAGIPKSDSETFWRRKLDDAAPLRFPVKSSGNGGETSTSSLDVIIPYERQGSSFVPSTILQSAWAMLLAEYTGCPDVTFGVTMSGRSAPLPGVDQLVGPIVAIVPNRTVVVEGVTIGDYLQEVQDETLHAMEHQHLGMQDIRRLSSAAENACMFQNIVNVYNAPGKRIESDAVFENLPRIPNPLSKFDTFPLVLDCSSDAKQITVTARFNTSSVPVGQAERLLHQLHDRVQRLSSLPKDTKLADVPLASMQDERQFLQNFIAPLCVSGPVHRIVEEKLREKPDGEAVVSWDGSLSNRQLNILSSKLARHLAHSGARPGGFIPVTFEKSMWTIVAQLAILKLGCAFAPLDPSHPPTRLREIVKELNATVAVCSLRAEELCRSFLPPSVTVSPNADWMQDEEDEATDFLPVETNPRDPAYVLFTSGSTGTPKGVVVSHEALCSSLGSHGKVLGLDEQTRMLQFCAYTFDVSLGEIWGTLIHGGCICVPNEEARSSLARTINAFSVNTALLTPTLAREFRPEDVPTLKTMTVGGEPMREDTIQVWSEKLNLVNGYGPTETTILSIMEPSAKRPSIIGRPVGCNCWITNPENHNVLSAYGTIGELLIEGPILADGYLNDPARSGAAFIQDPTWSLKQGLPEPRRFYKTGDLVQYTDEGSFRYVGRKESDGQVKLRGLRIELGEAEHHLNASTLVRHAVVIVANRGLCSGQLVGVLVFSDGQESLTCKTAQIVTEETSAEGHRSWIEKLKTSLNDLLPYYMVPTTWYCIQQMPQLTSGKTDRRTVTDWIETISTDGHARIVGSSTPTSTLAAPKTALEKDLQVLWADVLECSTSNVGTDRAFTALGSDSIRAMRLVAKCSAKGMKISMLEVLRTRSIRELASSVEHLAAMNGENSQGGDGDNFHDTLRVQEMKHATRQRMMQTAYDYGISPSNIEDVAECSVLQQDMLFSRKSLPHSNHVQTTWRTKTEKAEALDSARLVGAWQEVARRHAALRTIFLESTTANQKGFFSVVLKSHTPAINVRSTPPSGNADFVNDATAPPFVLGEPQHCATIWATTEQNAVVFRLEISHTVFDGVSWSILKRDLQSLYHGDRLEQPPSPRRLSRSNEATPDDANGYWASYLSEVDVCNVPKSAEATLSRVEAQWGSQTLMFDTARLSDFCRSVAVTLPNLLQTAWALTLSKIIAKDEVCFGCLVSNRMDVDDTYDIQTAGCGVDILVQRTRLDRAASIEEILHRVRDDCADHITQPRNSPLLSYHFKVKHGERRFNTIVNVRMFAQQTKESAGVVLEKRERMGFERIGGQDPWDVCVCIVLGFWFFFVNFVGRNELMKS